METLEELVQIYHSSGEGKSNLSLAEYLLSYSVLLEKDAKLEESVNAYNQGVKILD